MVDRDVAKQVTAFLTYLAFVDFCLLLFNGGLSAGFYRERRDYDMGKKKTFLRSKDSNLVLLRCRFMDDRYLVGPSMGFGIINKLLNRYNILKP